MNNKKILSLLLATAMLASLISCAASNGDDETTSDTPKTVQPSAEENIIEETEPAHVFPELDCDGADFVMLNCNENTWNMHTALDTEQNGELLNDAIWQRNGKVEEMYNLNFSVVNTDIYETGNYVQTMVVSDSDELDVAYIMGEKISPVISGGFLYDLANVPGLQLEESWWNQNARKNSVIGKNNSLFYAISDVSLSAFDLTWCVIFNKNMLTDLNLASPYDMVKEGTWTIDKLSEYCELGANLNGDDSFDFSTSGNSIYGIATYDNYIGATLIGTECFLTSRDESGNTIFSLESDRFYSYAEKIAGLFGKFGPSVMANDGDFHYEKIFKASRALFVGCELKASTVYRDFDDSFGVIPNPKLDESQQDYSSFINFLCLLMTVPVTCDTPERTGIVMDTLSYLTEEDVLPVYYDVTLSQKGLRDKESIEMLGIIRDSRYFEASLAYGWTTDVYYSIRGSLSKGNSNISSVVARYAKSVNNNIKKTLDSVNGD